MKAFAVIGTSAIGKAPFVTRLIEAYCCDGHAVSVIKHGPDGLDIDLPGKASFMRREAGATEVMLVGDRRLAILSEYGFEPQPPLEALMERLDPVDLVIVEGYHDTVLPTVEVYLPGKQRHPRYPENRHVVAVVSDEPLAIALPSFALDDTEALADFMATKIGLASRRRFARTLHAAIGAADA